jgi:hypothetical protein
MKKKLVTNGVTLVLPTLAALGSRYAQSNNLACNTNPSPALWIDSSGHQIGGRGRTSPQVGVAMTQFNGKGGLSQVDTVTINGEVVADWTHPLAIVTYR